MNCIKYLHDNGIRPSLHRAEVMRFLMENQTHPTVDTIYEALSSSIPTLSRTTIYNILSLFVEKGIAQSITIDPKQCRYDGDVSEHAHFMCTSCGAIHDIRMKPITIRCEHTITHNQLYLRGICNNCKLKIQ